MAKRILVCDDDAELRKALRLLLERDFEVVEASSGEEALGIIAGGPPDLVLLDVSMPGMTGLETLKAYGKTHPALPTIVLTTRQQLGIARRALDLGATEYVTKPFDPDLLLEEISRRFNPAPDTADPSGRPWRVAGEGRPGGSQ